MPPDVVPPVPLQRALELGLCRYVHYTVLVVLPPVTGGIPICIRNLPAEVTAGNKVEFIAINKWRIHIAPPPNEYIWKTFALTWGELSPAGTSLDIIITHGQYGMIEHEDPWIHSLVDYTYPHNLTLMAGRPEIMTFENLTAVDQTMDVTFHFMSFKTKEDWDAYQKLLRQGERLIEAVSGVPSDEGVPIGMSEKILAELKSIGRGIRVIPVLWKKKKEET